MANTIVNLVQGRSFTVYPSMSRTETPNTLEYRNLAFNATGIVLVTNVTAITDTPSITTTLYGVDPFADVTWTILASAAQTSASTSVLKVHPGITVSANAAVADVLPPNIRIAVDHADSDAITYTVTAHLLY